jgi:hypothetical protein
MISSTTGYFKPETSTDDRKGAGYTDMLIPISRRGGRAKMAELPDGGMHEYCKELLGRTVHRRFAYACVGRAIQNSLVRRLREQNPTDGPVSLYADIQTSKRQPQQAHLPCDCTHFCRCAASRESHGRAMPFVPVEGAAKELPTRRI